jgi:hypothetical protein
MTRSQCPTSRGARDAALAVNGTKATLSSPTALANVPCRVLP